MMLTEKSIGGSNFNIFLKALSDRIKAEFPEKAIRLGEYAYQSDGDVLEISCIGKKAYYLDDAFVIEDAENPDDRQIFTIPQIDGIDLADRIEVAWNKVQELLS